MSTDIGIRPALPADSCAARKLLTAAGLPVEDLAGDFSEGFIVAETTAELVGIIGLDAYGETGLLRSLVVERSCRGVGLGHQLVDELEAQAGKLGVAKLWLLTIDADEFFARLGYIAVDRDAVPGAIANTQEFTSLCPGDAVLMCKSIGGQSMEQ